MVEQEKLLDVPATHKPVYAKVNFSVAYALDPADYVDLYDQEFIDAVLSDIPEETPEYMVKELLDQTRSAIRNVRWTPIESPL